MKLTSSSVCLNCEKLLDGATAAVPDDAAKPSEGDLTICMYCSHLMAFDENLGLRALTDAEMVKTAGDPIVLLAMAEIYEARMYMEKKRGKANG